MPGRTTIVLEWTYAPKDFFEKEIKLKFEQCELVLDEGKAIAIMDADVYDSDPTIRKRLSDELDDRFLGAQLVNRKPYKLSKSVLSRIHPDGRKDITISIDSTVHITSVVTLDLVVKDAEGNVVSDSKQERLKKGKRFGELAAKYRRRDATTNCILLSFYASINDPDNELVHLYEIRDALSQRFAGNRVAREELGISNSQWSRIGRLANTEPIRQGRHRGEYEGVLRDATLDELNDARNIAIQMIYAYFEYLERSV